MHAQKRDFNDASTNLDSEKGALQSSLPALTQNADRVEEDLLQVSFSIDRSPNVSKYVMAGNPSDERPLMQRHLGLSELRKAYSEMIRNECFERHFHGPVDALFSKVMGVYLLANPFKFSSFARDKEGVKQYALLQHANEVAFHSGLRIPMEKFKQGDLEGALSSFRTAIDAAPGRRAEVYATLGHFCLLASQLQDDLNSGKNNIRRHLEDKLEFSALNSGLKGNPIVPEDESQSECNWSSSMLHDAYWDYPQPIDEQKLINTLKGTEIPLLTLAAESFLLAMQTEPEFEQYFGGGSSDRPNSSRLYYHAMATLCSGDFEGGLQQIASWKEELRDMNREHLLETKAWAHLKKNGDLDHAIQAYAELLQESLINHDSRPYELLLGACNDKSKVEGETRSKWELALPHLKAVCAEQDEIDVVTAEPNYYLGVAYYECADLKQAKKHLMLAIRCIDSELPYFEETDRREDEYAKRIRDMQKEASKHLNEIKAALI